MLQVSQLSGQLSFSLRGTNIFDKDGPLSKCNLIFSNSVRRTIDKARRLSSLLIKTSLRYTNFSVFSRCGWVCNVCCMTELINFFGYPLFGKVDFISHSDLFLDSESVDREMALLVSPMTKDLFRSYRTMIIPWGDTSAMDRFTYSVVVNSLVIGMKDTSVSRYGRVFCVGSSIVNLIASFKLLVMDTEFDVHAINISSISRLKKRDVPLSLVSILS